MGTAANGNKFIIQGNGVKVVTVYNKSVITTSRRIPMGSNETAFAFFVCGFSEEIENYKRFGMSPHITIYKTEAEVQEYCKGKVVSYSEFYADSEQEIDKLVAANRKLQKSHAESLGFVV